MPSILPADSTLTVSDPAREFSLLSFNIMHPNSLHGWWVSKYYDPWVPVENCLWPHRAKLLEKLLLQANADVLCLQELVPDSFDTDIAFLHAAGYESSLHKKNELRCATFWKSERFTKETTEFFCDRTMATVLRSRTNPAHVLWVINVHLKAGPEPARRLRQLYDVFERCEKTLDKQKANPAHIACVVAGDFNANAEGSALREFLYNGSVAPAFREELYPDVELTSRVRGHRMGRFVDAYAEAYEEGKIPPSMLLPTQYDYFADPSTGMLRAEALEKLRAMYRLFASAPEGMTRDEMHRWIKTINGAPERGSEWTKACELVEKNPAGTLTEEAFIEVYLTELRDGKPWSVWHDLYQTGILSEPAPWKRVFTARYDQLHVASNMLEVLSVREPLNDEGKQRVFTHGETLPNAWHPSDHLPIATVLRWKQ